MYSWEIGDRTGPLTFAVRADSLDAPANRLTSTTTFKKYDDENRNSSGIRLGQPFTFLLQLYLPS